MENFTELPTAGTTLEMADDITITRFGDGYEQRARQGINSQRMRFALEFGKVTREKARRVSAFLKARGSTEAFLWVAPAPYDDQTRVWVARTGWSNKIDGFDQQNLNVIFEEQFQYVERVAQPVIEITSNGAGGFTVTITTTTPGAVLRYTWAAAGGELADPRPSDTLWPGGFDIPADATDVLLSTHNTHGSEEISVYHLIGAPVPEVGDILHCDGLDLTISSVATFAPDDPDTQDARYLCGLVSDATGIDVAAPVYLRTYSTPSGEIRARGYKPGMLDSPVAAEGYGGGLELIAVLGETDVPDETDIA